MSCIRQTSPRRIVKGPARSRSAMRSPEVRPSGFVSAQPTVMSAANPPNGSALACGKNERIQGGGRGGGGEAEESIVAHLILEEGRGQIALVGHSYSGLVQIG